MSVSSTGRQANYDYQYYIGPASSADGRFLEFASDASNLVPGDTNGAVDVFVRDRLAGVTERVSVSSNGQQGNADSGTDGMAISANGRFVAFSSDASNLVPGDTNGATDVFVRDRLTGVTRRVSVGSHGQQGNGQSSDPSISADGWHVAFQSSAPNLVPGDTNQQSDIFVRDRLARVTRRVSVGVAGQANGWSWEPTISADGRYVAFTSNATNLVRGLTITKPRQNNVFVRDRLAGVTQLVSLGAAGQGNNDSVGPAISADGRYVAFASYASNLVPRDTNGESDVFVRDRLAGVTRRVSVASNGQQANGFSSLYGTVAISADGRYVAFDSSASNLVPGDTNYVMDVFVRDQLTGVTRRISVASNGDQGNNDSILPAITADGRSVAFDSLASNLVPRDTNNSVDVFARDPLLGR